MNKPEIILASASEHRKNLLRQINIIPDKIDPADIDETQLKKENFTALVKRLSISKCKKIALKYDDAIIIAADTIVICKNRLLDKATNDEMVEQYLRIASGSRTKVLTSVTLIRKKNNEEIFNSTKLVTSVAKIKRLTEAEIKIYLDSKQGIGKSGGLEGDGYAGCFIKYFSGSWSAVIGLPLYETKILLNSAGYKDAA